MAEQTPETPEPNEPVVFNIAEATDEQLLAEYGRVRTAGAELSAKADADPTELSGLASQLQELSAAVAERKTRAEATQAARDAFSNAPELTIPTQVIPETSAPVTPDNDVTPEPAAPAPVPSVSQMAAQTQLPAVPAKPETGSTTITAHVLPSAAGFVRKNAGDAFSGVTEISQALIQNAQSFGSKGAPGTRQAIAQFRRQRENALVVDTLDGNETMAILRHARDEKRLYGGSLAKAWQHSIDTGAASLTAAAGWCAPSQNDYDLCRNWSAGVGTLDLPTVTVTRGGINYTDEPIFPDIYANAVAVGGGSNFLTEAQVIADTPKTCSEIPCPTFENRRLDVMALCIRVSFLQAAGYPEVVNTWQDGLLAAHEAEMNRLIIADLIARAGAATVFASPDPDGDSFTSAILASAELAAEDIRYRFHMAWNATVELAYPHWILPQIRADLSRRNGVNLLSVTDAEIASMFSTRNVRVQFVRGWQDGLITGGALNAAFPGGDATAPYMTSLPNSVSFLAWPAGSVAVARQDVVTLTNVYDAASLAQNEFTSLFAEEGFAPIYPCPGQRLYTVTGCVGGLTGAAAINCVDDTP
ncbi:major capsid protein [Streptomyces tanashiensis]|uniref:major capsid protein n=1 Tax=Streptomyces tanashiensis TaxID=67367 RepID=UPI0033DA2356